MHHGDADSNARRFAAQTSWDDTMAESMVDYLGKHPGRRIMHIAGNFHVEGGSGIASRIASRNPALKVALIITQTGDRQPWADPEPQMSGSTSLPAGTLAKCKGNEARYGRTGINPEAVTAANGCNPQNARDFIWMCYSSSTCNRGCSITPAIRMPGHRQHQSSGRSRAGPTRTGHLYPTCDEPGSELETWQCGLATARRSGPISPRQPGAQDRL